MGEFNRRLRDIARKLAEQGPVSLVSFRAHLKSEHPEIYESVDAWEDDFLEHVLTRGEQLWKCKRGNAGRTDFVWIKAGGGAPDGYVFASICAVVMVGLNEKINCREALAVVRRVLKRMMKMGRRGTILIVPPYGKPPEGGGREPMGDDDWSAEVARLVTLGRRAGIDVEEVATWLDLTGRLHGLGSGVSLFVFYTDHATGDGVHIGGQRVRWDEFVGFLRTARWVVKFVVLEACWSGCAITAVKRGREQPDSCGCLAVLSSASPSGRCQRTSNGSCFTRRFLELCWKDGTFSGLGTVLQDAQFHYEVLWGIVSVDRDDLRGEFPMSELLCPDEADPDDDLPRPTRLDWGDGRAMDDVEGGAGRLALGRESDCETLLNGLNRCGDLSGRERERLVRFLTEVVPDGRTVTRRDLNEFLADRPRFERVMEGCYDGITEITQSWGLAYGYFCEVILLAAGLRGLQPKELLEHMRRGG
jgi:hypothetical protein